ncbi:MAG: flagellar basal body-associated FliL family protein [Candidatus Hydrogenedentes bacterium]|nr:flagellar basal body-associated FliL family protein [Candidatus Hydrogenedentota bacterium]
MARDAGPPPEGAGRQDENQQSEKKGGGLPLKLIIPLVAVLVGAGAGVGLALFVLVPRMKPPEEVKTAKPLAETEKLVQLQQIIVNIESQYGTDFLVVDITLVCADDKSQELVNNSLDAIRDALSAMLSTKKYEDVQGVVGREQLKREIKDKLNGILGSGTIAKVYIPNLVVQSM